MNTELRLGTVTAPVNGRVMVQIDGADTSVPCWPGYTYPAVGDRVVLERIGRELYVFGARKNDYDTGWLTTGIVTAAGGHTLTRQNARKIGDIVSILVQVTLTSAITVTAATGNCTDTVLATPNSGWDTACPYAQVIPGGVGPFLQTGYVSPNGLYISAVAPNQTLVSGTLVSLGGTYLR